MKVFYGFLVIFSIFILAACDESDEEINGETDNSEVDQDNEDSIEQDNDDSNDQDNDSILLEFYDQNDTLIESVKTYQNDDIMFPDAPTKEGYNFQHWDIAWDMIDFNETSMAVYPIFEPAQYLITIMGPEGEIDAYYLKHGDTLELDDGPEIDGYTFEGYEDYPNTVVESLTIEALYSPVKTTITLSFYDFEAEFIETITVDSPSDITPPVVDKVDDHSFKGWSKESSETLIDLNTLDYGSYELYATYEYDGTPMVDIYFDANDGSDPVLIQRSYESYIDIEDFPEVTREDYVFSHWVEAYWNTEVFSGFEVFQEDPITFLAKWDGLTDEWRFDVTDEGAKLVEYLGDDRDVVIPKTIGGEPVSIIGESLFEVSAFQDGVLDSVVIGENVHTIEDDAFRRNNALASVTFENPENIKVIGNRSFQNVDALNLMVPTQLNYIGEQAFLNTHIHELSFEGNLEFIGSEAFKDTLLGGDISFPDTLRTIEDGAFKNLDIPSIELNDGLETIGSEVFKNNTELTSLTIPSSVKSIDQRAFKGLSELETVTFEPESQVTELSTEVFANTPKLQHVVFPENLITIHARAFEHNDALTTLTLPDSANEFRNFAFSGMLALESFVVPDGITRIEPSTFYNTPSLKDITLPDSLEDIAASAFRETGLKTLDIPDNVTTIRSKAFSRSSNLETIELPEDLERLDSQAFRDATNLKSITIPETIKEIEYGLFRGATRLETIHLHSDIREIGAYAFKDTPALDDLILPNIIHTIRHSAFKNSGIHYIYIPSRVDTVYERVFSGALNVTIAYEGNEVDIEDWHWNFNPDDRPLLTNADKPEE